jgi:hypothetical protein
MFWACHVKGAQYGIDDTKVCVGLSKVSLKEAQSSLQKTSTWIKKFGKGWQEWKRSCIIIGQHAKMLKTPVKTQFASHVILFQETLKYYNVISILLWTTTSYSFIL